VWLNLDLAESLGSLRLACELLGLVEGTMVRSPG
jgi:hypothetical protein